MGSPEAADWPANPSVPAARMMAVRMVVRLLADASWEKPGPEGDTAAAALDKWTRLTQDRGLDDEPMISLMHAALDLAAVLAGAMDPTTAGQLLASELALSQAEYDAADRLWREHGDAGGKAG
jgi:hypothetical protein